jgi:hypothetical protein
MAKKLLPKFEIGQRIKAIVDSQFVNYRQGDEAIVLKQRGLNDFFVRIDGSSEYWIIAKNWEKVE